MKKQMSEWYDKWNKMNERTQSWTSVGMNEWMYEWMNMNKCINEWTNNR